MKKMNQIWLEIMEWLQNDGWETTGLPWQWRKGQLFLVCVREDMLLFSIQDTRYDETVFRGQILCLSDLKKILTQVDEHKHLDIPPGN